MMDFREFLDVVESLIQGDSEAEWRSAASRAYYAAFHVAGEFLESLGFKVPRMERAHAYAWLRLSNSSHAPINTAGSQLNDLRSERNRADYDAGKPFAHGKAEDCVDAANAIIKAIDDIAQGSTRSVITETIKTYERDVLKEVTWKPT